MVFDHLFIYSFLGITLVAWCCGLLSPFVYTRSQSLLADTLSHAAFPGVPVGLYIALTFSAIFSPWQNGFIAMMTFLFSALALFLQRLVLDKSKLKSEATLAILLGGFFALGFLVFNVLSSKFGETSGLLSTFLYGNVSALQKNDLAMLLPFAILLSVVVFFFHRLFGMVAFNPSWALGLDYSVHRWALFLDFLILFVLCLGLPMMGVLLMGTLLVAPAAAAKFWTKRFSTFSLASIFFALTTSWLAVFFSALYEKIPAGPLVAVIAVTAVLASMLLRMLLDGANYFFKKMPKHRASGQEMRGVPREQRSLVAPREERS